MNDDAKDVLIKPLPFKGLDKAAYYGLAGDYARLIEPFTESDTATIIFQFLTLFGNAAGRSAHLVIENTKHFMNMFCILIGNTSDSRKGGSFAQAHRLFEFAADSSWTIKKGLVSGEGIIHHVRDPMVGFRRDKKTGELTSEVIDSGVTDKRCMVVEPEFARVLTNAAREGNTLSTTIREAWETGDLRNMGRQSKEFATNAHISIIGHITPLELGQRLSETDSYDGFANRFIWLHTRRTKVLAFAEQPNSDDIKRLANRLRRALAFALTCTGISFSPEAAAMYEKVYPRLSSSRPGLLGVMLARAAPQVVRLALIYAVLDLKNEIGAQHLRAALALWEYSERSAQFYFGASTRSPAADKILAALHARKDQGLTRTEITKLFSNHRTDQITTALLMLSQQKLAQPVEEPTSGRSVERWRATSKHINPEVESYLAALNGRYPQRVLRAHAAREKRMLDYAKKYPVNAVRKRAFAR